MGFPIAEVSRQAVREKSIRRGHPSTLHPWWARRPLASSRAILTALLLPDPCDARCPKTFKEEARHILLTMYGRPPGETLPIEQDEGLRRMMLKFIADFADWDNAAKPKYLKTGPDGKQEDLLSDTMRAATLQDNGLSILFDSRFVARRS